MNSVSCLVACVALTMLGASAVRGGEAWYAEFEEGRAAAVAGGKDLLIDFGGSDWCAPCKWLKDRVFSKPEFIERAARDFVLVDIDLLMRKDAAIPPDRKERYEQFQERYGIATFPSVLLALPDGRPYARTTYREAIETPDLYWKHLAPLQERGRRLRGALKRSEKLQGRERADALAEGLSEVDARFVYRFYAGLVADLRAADPTDPTGYLAFLDGRRALDELEARTDLHEGTIRVPEVESLISRLKLRGESLQEAPVIRAVGEVLAGEDRTALQTFAAVLDAQSSRNRFDHGDFVPLDPKSIDAVRRRIAEGEAAGPGEPALDYALHRIFEFEMPDAYEMPCGQGFRPDIRVRGVIGDRYGQSLIRSTEGLDNEARAGGLDGTFFSSEGSIGVIIRKMIPDLVGKKAAKALLPGKFYPMMIQ